jgi:hypothetical protein
MPITKIDKIVGVPVGAALAAIFSRMNARSYRGGIISRVNALLLFPEKVKPRASSFLG